MVRRKGIPTDYVQTSIEFLLIISTHYVIPTDHVHPLYHVYRQLLMEIECWTLYISQQNNELSLLSMMLYLQISRICQHKNKLSPLVLLPWPSCSGGDLMIQRSSVHILVLPIKHSRIYVEGASAGIRKMVSLVIDTGI